MKVLGFKVFEQELNTIDLNNKIIINTLNASAFVWSKKDDDYKNALLKSDILLPDGIAVTIAARLLLNKKIRKQSGEDIFYYLLNEVNNKKETCFFLGSSQLVLDRINKRINNEFPDIKIERYSPPFRNTFSEEDMNEMIRRINSISPFVLFVGISAPKQEKLIFKMGEQLNVNIICNIGAVFEFYAETLKRPSAFWRHLGLEWLIIWFIDPKRLRKKEYISIFLFLLLLLKEFYILKKKKK